MTHLRSYLLAAASFLAFTGCSAGHKNRFPDRAKLEQVAARPLPVVTVSADARGPASWRPQGPFSDTLDGANVEPQSPAEKTLAELLPADARSAPVALQCASRELGAYLLAEGESPSGDLRAYLGGRCGVLSRSALRVSWVHGEVGDDETDEVLLARWRTSLAEQLGDLQRSGGKRFGIWSGRSGKRAVAVLTALMPSQVQLEPLARRPDAEGHYVIRGRVSVPAERVDAAITRGVYDFEECVALPGVSAPDFAFQCPSDVADAEAWIDVSVLPPGRFIRQTLAEVWVTPSGAPPAEWRRPSFGSDPGEEVALEPRVTKMVNEVRAQAGRKPLTLSLQQTVSASKLAPHFFAAAAGEDPERLSDTIGLGLMAGWDVESDMVRDGTFISTHAAKDAPLSELVGGMLARAGGRRVLLHEESRLVALGLVEQGNARSALVLTYRLLEPKAPNEEAREVMAALNRQRAAVGLEPAVWVAPPGNAAEEAADVLKKGGDPRRGTRLLLDRAYEVTGAPMRGWTLVTAALSELRFPDELVRAPKLAVVVAVGHHRLEGDPWASYVVMLALPDMSAVRDEATIAGTVQVEGWAAQR